MDLILFTVLVGLLICFLLMWAAMHKLPSSPTPAPGSLSPAPTPTGPPTYSPVAAPGSLSPAPTPTGPPTYSPVAAPASLPTGCTLEAPWKFYTRASIDNTHGIDEDGNLAPHDMFPDQKWQSMQNSINDARFFLKAPISAKNTNKWSDVVRSALNYDFRRVDVSSPDQVLLVEGDAKIVIGASTELEGLVVRRGGSVLLCPLDTNELLLTVQFITVESGGLLQCGFAGEKYNGTEKSEARLDSNLKVIIQIARTPGGYTKAGVPCSQYPSDVLQPGVVTTAADADHCASDYVSQPAASCLTNATSPRCVAVLFNGNMHFAGHIPQMNPYAIWKASKGKVEQVNDNSYLTGVTLATASERAASEYSLTWAPLASKAAIGDRTIVVSAAAKKLDWPVGSQIVITALSQAWNPTGAFMDIDACDYSRSKRGEEDFHECTPGVMPFFADEKDAVLESFEGNYGIEVCTISAIDGLAITLAAPLRLNHSQQHTSTFEDIESDIVTVETPVHVGLLSRNILIRGRTNRGDDLSSSSPHSKEGVPVHFFQDSSIQATMEALPRGKFNKVMPTMPRTATESDADFKDRSTWEGPGGSIVCNRHVADFSNKPASIYTTIQSRALPSDIGPFLHGEAMTPMPCAPTPPPSYQPRGSYLLGDSKCEGLDCIVGGTVKVQYAAAFVFDGVELYNMGLPGNCGSLGQYSLHFHCAGWGPEYRDYARVDAYRHLRFCNSSNWRSYSRWVVIHGTNFAHVSNNVLCTAMGNGVFFEDGVEHHNAIEHNLMCNCVMTGEATEKLNVYENQTQNPSNVIGNGGFDNYPVASIWLTNTYNFIFRNVICNNATSGIAVWVLPVNPRTKSGPANLCTGNVKWKLPGLIGVALIGHNNTRSLSIDCVPTYMQHHFVKIKADNSWEALGNVKNFAGDPSLQTYVLFAENTLYSLTGGIVEANNENTVWARDPKCCAPIGVLALDATNYIPINGEPSGSLVADNPQTYPTSAVTIGQKGSDGDIQAQYVPRAFWQNRVYAFYGLKLLQLGGFIWAQQGTAICMGNCILGGEYWSAGSSLKLANINTVAVGNFSCVHADAVTNCSLSGSGGMRLKLGCPGVLVVGDRTVLGKRTCVGARTAAPKGVALSCVPQDNDEQPAFIMFGKGFHYDPYLRQLIQQWLFDYSVGPGLGPLPPDYPVFPALGGLADKGTACCSGESIAFPFLCDLSKHRPDYVFFVEDNLRVGYNQTFTALKESTWDPIQALSCDNLSVPLCASGCHSLASYAADVYPSLQNAKVVSIWTQICQCIRISPGVSERIS